MNYRSTSIRILHLIIGISGTLSVSNAQDKQKSEEPMFGQFEANAAYPYGRPNPDAPEKDQTGRHRGPQPAYVLQYYGSRI